MLSDLLKRVGKRGDAASGKRDGGSGEEPVVASKAFPKLVSTLSSREAPVLLDFGPVIGANVAFCGERLGCKLFIEDILGDIDRHRRGEEPRDLAAAFEHRFRHADGSIDGILCWDLFDYLDKNAAQALARQIVRLLRPGGAVMGFFCTASVDFTGFTKFEIVDEKTLRHRHHGGVSGRKHSIPNRDILRMFEGLIVADSFLLKNNTREMLLRKKPEAAPAVPLGEPAAASEPAATPPGTGQK
jgi:hypothetical protein